MHTNLSDGELPVDSLVQQAAAAGIDCLAITDHDSVGNVGQARVVAQPLGVKVISGVELSSQWDGQEVHVVGLGMDEHDITFGSRLLAVQQQRQQRCSKIVSRLEAAGCEDVAQQVAIETRDAVSPGRLHVARALVRTGAVKNINQAFNRYLSRGQSGYVPTRWPELAEVIQWVHEAGGVAVLAHLTKYRLSRTKQRRLATTFKAAGGDGLEVIISGSNKTDRDYMLQLAKSHDLKGSVGSDYHGPSQRWLKLGQLEPLPDQCDPVWALL